MKKAALLLSALILLGCGKQRDSTKQIHDPAPDAKTVARIEALAKNAVAESDYDHAVNLKNIAKFERFYSFKMEKGRLFIWGELYPGGHGELHLVGPHEMRYIFDGGCGAITLFYDLKTANLVSVQCHGIA